MQSENKDQKLIYVRRLFDMVIHWYKNADTKAQAVLTLNGVIVTFITGFIVLKPNEIGKIIKELGTANYTFLALMGIFLIISIICALYSFQSRLKKKDSNLSQEGYSIPPGEMWFGGIAKTRKIEFRQVVQDIDLKFELTALADQIHILSINVLHKHRWVIRSFLAFGLSIIAFILFIASYIVQLAS